MNRIVIAALSAFLLTALQTAHADVFGAPGSDVVSNPQSDNGVAAGTQRSLHFTKGGEFLGDALAFSAAAAGIVGTIIWASNSGGTSGTSGTSGTTGTTGTTGTH